MKTPFKIFFTFAAAMYCFYYFSSVSEWHFIDYVNLVIHEAGHYFFFAFGNFAMIAGGSILQILVPIPFIFYFYFTGQKYSSGFMFYWLAISFFSVGYYASDAVAMKIHLITEDSAGHDWHNMLTMLGKLDYTSTIASYIYAAGIISIILGLALCCFAIWRTESYPEIEN